MRFENWDSWSVDVHDQRTAEGTFPSSENANNALDWKLLTMSEGQDSPNTNNHGGTNSPTQ